MKKKDWIIISIIFCLLIIFAIIWKILYSQPGRMVVVAVDNKVLYTESLYVNKYIVIENNLAYEVQDEESAISILNSSNKATNILVISGGVADMVAADCPDKICVDMKQISNVGESIVCMPNRLYVTIK